MSSETSKNGFNNKEYMYVRRLISVLTNDDSDKLIIEKLKGKNLSSLLYNAKIIDNSKNMAANKRILGCVIRAIDREKQFCRRREIDQSWGRKLLASFNCLSPLKPNDDLSEPSYIKTCTIHRRPSRRTHKHFGLSRGKPNQSVTTESKTCAKHSRVCSSGFSERKDLASISVQNNGRLETSDVQLGRCTFLAQKKAYETVCPILWNKHRPMFVNYAYFEPPRKLKPTFRAIPPSGSDKITSSTQTFESRDLLEKELPPLPNNIKLQDLLEAATSLINTRDQKEYVKSFLSNFEPPFDLASGFPPYLKLPMEPLEDFGNKESIYGSNSDLSVMSGAVSSRRVFECGGEGVDLEKDNHVKKYVRELSDPWQEAAESIISGVINETLPHDKADYSQLGACILKRLGAYPNNGFMEQKLTKMNTIVPEIVLSCTEWFESGSGDSEKKNDKDEKKGIPTEENEIVNKTTVKLDANILPNTKVSRESIEEIELLEGDVDRSKVNWEHQMMQNYCFVDGSLTNTKVGLLDVSEGSITDIKISTGEDAGDVIRGGVHSSQDRKHFLRRQPLTISPSVLNEPNKKERAGSHRNSAGDAPTKWCDIPVNKTQKTAQERKPVGKGTISTSKAARDVQNVVLQNLLTVESIPNKLDAEEDGTASARVESKTEFLTEPPEPVKKDSVITTYVSTPEKEDIATPENVLWEPTAIEVETYDGLGECPAKVTTDSPNISESPSDKKLGSSKHRGRMSFQDRFRGKKKCKNSAKAKQISNTKEEVDLSRNCKVM